MAQKQEWDTADGELIYESAERGLFYKWVRVLWCACCEPYHKITTKYVRIHRWDGCAQITDSMAMEAVSDVQKEQSGCCCVASCCCGCVIHDFGDVILFGEDASVSDGQVRLQNVANSDQVMVTLTKNLQQLHKGFRQHGKNLGAKIEEIKHK